MPGENWIDPNERAGLPGTSDLESFSREKAQDVVRAHTRNKKSWGNWFSFGEHGHGREKKNKKHRHDADEKSSDGGHGTDIESTAFDPAPSRRMGGGVLSALLTLYDHQNASQSTLSPISRRNSIMSDTVEEEVARSEATKETVNPPSKPWLYPRRQHAPKPADPGGVPSSPPPHGSKLVPPGAAAKRPGYMLSRYVHLFSSSPGIPY